MNADSWVHQSLGAERLRRASIEASARRLGRALDVRLPEELPEDQLRFVADALELRVYDLLEDSGSEALRAAALEAFAVARTLRCAREDVEHTEETLRLGCLGVLADRGADVRRILDRKTMPSLPLSADDWGVRVWATILDTWIRLLRKDGWDDFHGVERGVAALRAEQRDFEPRFLDSAEKRGDARPAWALISAYHLAKAAEVLGFYLTQGSVDGHYDIREQLEAQFDRAIAAAERGRLIEHEVLVRLLARTARVMVDNSIWTVTRAVNTRVTDFVTSLVRSDRPMFEMLPPQRRVLREEGLLRSSYRSVIVSLPTSSGKTFIAQFRILQALNQFDRDQGWVAYLAPTRALVNQLTQRLRRDFSPLGIAVEKVSPALEVDSLEADMLLDSEATRRFRLLVTTPEKLDLLLRGGWEEKIGRPLTLVVVDEAHGIGSGERGLRLELLLATINRECRHAQFLMLTPFVPNTSDIARWLDPDNHRAIELSLDWSPNDRIVAIARPMRGRGGGRFSIRLVTKSTAKARAAKTLAVPYPIDTEEGRPLGLSWSDVSRSPSKLAAATAQLLQKRGTVIVLVDKPATSWKVADSFRIDENRVSVHNEDLAHIRKFMTEEMGSDFPLTSLLEYGIGVHHAGLSDDVRSLVEWLTEQSKLRVLVATTTIAQGVNFPVSGVVITNHRVPTRAGSHSWEDMRAEDFWNIAGRAGRVDQGDLGVVALVAENQAQEECLSTFIERSVDDLNSTLITMVQTAYREGRLGNLSLLVSEPGWSAFLQYLAHSYRQIGDHDRFADEIEQVLRGTLGFQKLRVNHRGWADTLVRSVRDYADKIRNQPLKLVDATGFSWESVSKTLARLRDERLDNAVWSPEIFGRRRRDLARMMGILLTIPELRANLVEVTGKHGQEGDLLARIVCDWVQGRPLAEMALAHFSRRPAGDTGDQLADPTTAMTRCCRGIFGRLTQTASWGLSALQSLTLKDSLDEMTPEEQLVIRNLPARVYYGVNSDEAIALRLLGVPRTAAAPLARSLGVTPAEPLHAVRTRLRAAPIDAWNRALGSLGDSYHRVWSILEGTVRPSDGA